MNFDLALDCNSYSIFSPTEYIDRTKIVNLKGILSNERRVNPISFKNIQKWCRWKSCIFIFKQGEITSGWDITSTVTGCQNAVKSVKYQFTYKNL